MVIVFEEVGGSNTSNILSVSVSISVDVAVETSEAVEPD